MDSDPNTYHASSGDGSSELPDGMTFSGQTLSWSPSVAGTRYVKFWVTTESGGTDAIIAEFVVTGHGGCPFVDTRTAAGWQVENSVLSRSLTNEPALDSSPLKGAHG